MAVFSYLLILVVMGISYMFYFKYVNTYPSIFLKPQKRYDYIIDLDSKIRSFPVGAGTAGCVLAARLSEDPKNKILLIEAGDQMGYFTKIPLTPTAAQLGPNDWSVRTAPQKYSSFGLWNQTQILPRGKGLGGSGQINFLIHGFGLPEDFDEWFKLGFKGWISDDLKPYFLKAFGSVKSEFDSSFCSVHRNCPGTKAPMKLQLIDERDELFRIFRQASNKLSDKFTLFRKTTATVKNGARHSTLDAYLKPAMARKNLHVVLKTQAVSIRFEGTKASSLYILRNHRDLDNVFINKEIILAAGAVKSPQLLMLSGIGPRNVLKRLQIKPIVHNEWVGKNLHDHMNMPIYVSIQRPISITLAKVFTFSTLSDYLLHGTGVLSFPPVAGIEYHNSSAIMLFSLGTASERLLKDLSNYKPKVFRDTFAFHNDNSKEGFMFLATCVQPRSRGYVTLRDVSTGVPPVVDPNYLSDEFDVRCMIKAIRRAERMVNSKHFQEIGAKIHWPRPERCMSLWKYTKNEQLGIQTKIKLKKYRTTKKVESPPDAYLECIIREVAVTGHHVGGSCSGGVVVDDQLRVKSVSGVRVVDASILPAPVSLFPNSVLVTIAEKAADMIKYSNQIKSNQIKYFYCN